MRENAMRRTRLFCVAALIAFVGALNLISSKPSPAAANETSPPLYLLTYDHGGMVLWGRDQFLEGLRNATAWLDRYPSFKIGLDNEAYTYDYLAEHEPQILDEIRADLKKYAGRFGIGTCTYGQPLSQFINEESNVRQIGYALEADRRLLGRAPTVYLMSEHANHSQIPQLLAGFGFTGSIMRTHFMMYGYNPTFNAATGWWVGVDGSRIPTVPTYEGEGAEFGRTTVDNWILTRFPSPDSKMSPEEFRAKFAGISPLLASRADDTKLRREELVKRYEGRPGYRWILLEELFPAFPKPTQELKTAPNDFHVRMPWGYCGNEIWNLSRRAEVAVLTAERLAAIERLLGGEDREKEIRQAWKNLLVAQHHDIQICGLLPDARKFLPASIAASERATSASMAFVASQMESGSKAQVTLFNPLSWPREEWVTISLPATTRNDSAKVPREGTTVAAFVRSANEFPSSSTQQMALFYHLPPLGFVSALGIVADSSLRLEDTLAPVDGPPSRITSSFFDIRLSSQGGIASLVDRRSGQELLSSRKRSAFFAGRVDGRDCESSGTWTVERRPWNRPWNKAFETGRIGGIPYTLEMIVRVGTPRLDFRVTFHFEGQKIGRLSNDKRDNKSGFIHEEKLRFKLFPAVGEGATGVRDLPFVIAETADRYVEGNYWTALTDGKVGVAIFNRGTMGSVRESDGGFSVPLAFAMYYVWGTRMLNGDFTYEFAIYPFAGKWQDADLHRRALEYSFPVVTAVTAAGNGHLGNRLSLLDIPSSDVILSAFYSEGGRTFARMYEHQGRAATVSLKYLLGRARLTEVDLAGSELGPAQQPMALRAWQIRTVRIEPGM
jgi:alpha-mannosidase